MNIYIIVASLIAAAGQPTTMVVGQATTTTAAAGTTTTVAGGTTTTVAAGTTTTTAASSTCVDKINPKTGTSDCPRLASYCNNSAYYSLMTDQCPKTCNRCGASSATTTAASSTCVDKVNPNTGVSNCPGMANLCNDSNYYDLMTQQCPKTCNRCPSGRK